MRPYRGRQILGIIYYIIGIRTESGKLQLLTQPDRKFQMRIKVRIRIIVFHLQPGQRIGDLAGIGNTVPRSGLFVPVVGKGRIERCRRIKRLLDIIQVTVLLQGTENTHIYFQPVAESLLRNIQFNGKVLHIICPYHPVAIHHTEGCTIVGCFRATAQSDMMVLHDPDTGNLIGEVRVIAQVQDIDIPFIGNRAEVVARKHLHILINRFHSETTIVTDTERTAFPLLGCHFDHTGSTARTILCRFGSIFQDREALYIRRINGTKRTQIGRNPVDNDQRIITTGQGSSTTYPDRSQGGRPVRSRRNTDTGRLAA